MVVQVRLFAALREAAGGDSITLELPEGATVAEALEALSGRPPLGRLLTRLPVRMAVNRVYADAYIRLSPDDELALIPPVSGGAAPHVRVTSEPLSAAAVAAAVADSRAGAIVTFGGVPREVGWLEYEAYGEMAQERITAILGECVRRHRLLIAAAEHRIGTVPLGELAVIVAASAAHREEAFAGVGEAIDRIKAEVPIWKREMGGMGWLAG